MLNQRKASPALYELLGRNTRIISGKQIGGRDTPDGAEEAAEAHAQHAHAHHPPAPTSHVAPAHRPGPVTPPQRRYTSQDEADHERRAPAPLRVARPPVHAPAPPPRERAHTHTHEVESTEPAPAVALGPGRAVRVPTGYFLFGVAAVLAAGIAGVMFGYVQKEREVNEAERQAVQRGGAILTEPLGDEPPIVRQPPAKAPAKPASGDQGIKTAPSTPTKQAAKPGSGVVVVGKGIPDPRSKGLNYAVVASLGNDRAIEVAEFLTAAGVESAVLPRNTIGLYPVVSLTGFAKGDFQTKARQEHENRLRELGKQYAKQGGGRKDFSDLWWSRYDG